jgi:hypothetical protein
MISRITQHHVGLHASRVAEDLQKEVWGFAQAVSDAQNQHCADNRMNYWKSRLTLSVEHAKARGMEIQEIAHQCEFSLSRSQRTRPLAAQTLFLIESFLRQQGIPARLNGQAEVFPRR